MKNRRIFMNLICLALLAFVCMICPTKGQDKKAADKPNSLKVFLMDLGKSYNCYFTIEEAWQEGGLMDGLQYKQVFHQNENIGLQRELDSLTRELREFDYEVNPINPKIIHIKDARLNKQSNYALDMSVSNINTQGNFFDLVTSINKQGIPIENIGVAALSDLNELDMKTKLSVKADNLKVRYVLSNFCDLKGRNRVIWTSRTKIGTQEESYIRLLSN